MSGVRVLLAEDSRADVLLVQEALREYEIPHDLCIVRDGGEALNFISRMAESGEYVCPDLMVLDLNLPKADGLAILMEFRKHPLCARTPVIVISSSDAPSDRARVAAVDFTRYFRKPSDLDEFLKLGAVVREAIGRTAPPLVDSHRPGPQPD